MHGAPATPSLGAYKPFVTEYKLAFKDPTPFMRKSGSTKKQPKRSSQPVHRPFTPPPAQPPVVAPAIFTDDLTGVLPALPRVAIVAAREMNGRKSKATKNLWAPPPQRTGADSTSLTLPAMTTQGHQPTFDPSAPLVKTFRRRRVLNPVEKSTTAPPEHRYNILSGDEIFGEPYSGYKPGRRAVIQTFARIDMTTNARTPGYNIISNRDYLTDHLETLSVS